ncbi:MFS transporter [Actinacidiphila oryziradicis]|jgi:EmrB/QacA subfamily drug resistance transporter|uniref:MFS transporter n=1 Tax=Actinacidiphila oryziradicis TaxID=2571141 RepID=A0A4U0RM19_9ACTN|nr:MDR family MFS transporter [Actinacidiphila oryziradicis]TJZ96815.1 MFS transporter [Actinacidiphila oryziradicis]
MATSPTTSTAATPDGRGIGLRSERGPVLIAIMLSTGLVALDSTILATAVPSVVRDLGGFSQFPWLFSVYLLTQAVTVPLYGKFADSLGRKPVMFFGIAAFLLGSVLCGVAWSMPLLIVARAVQGIGAGAVQPISMTMVGDLYTVKERARVQGYVASVWGIASVIGPTLGGLFSEYLSWRLIFFVNLPLGAVAVWMLSRHFSEKVTRKNDKKVDYAGAAALTGGFSLLILGLLEGSVAWGWASPPSIAIFVIGIALLVGFFLIERRAAEPVLPPWVFRHRILAGGNLSALVIGALMIGLSSYLPTYAEGVLGKSAVVAGFALAALTVGWPLAASLSGRIYLRIGFRDTALIGSVFVVAGAVLVTLLGEHTSIWFAALAAFVLGVGLGLSASPTVVAAQSVVTWERRGVVTATNMFSRSLGSAVGAAVFGAIANASLAASYANPPAAVAGKLSGSVNATSLTFGPAPKSELPAVARFLRDSLYEATHHVFLGLVVLAVLGVGALLLMPRHSEPLAFD